MAIVTSSSTVFNTLQLQTSSAHESNNAVNGRTQLRLCSSKSILNGGEELKRLIKDELFEAIAPLDHGANANLQQQDDVDKIVCKLEGVNEVKEPLKSNLMNGKWELLYTTSQSLLQTNVCFYRHGGDVLFRVSKTPVIEFGGSS